MDLKNVLIGIVCIIVAIIYFRYFNKPNIDNNENRNSEDNEMSESMKHSRLLRNALANFQEKFGVFVLIIIGILMLL